MKVKLILLTILLTYTTHLLYAQKAADEWKETPNRITLSWSILIHNSDPGYGVNMDYVRFDGKKISAPTPSVKLTHEVQASLGFCF